MKTIVALLTILVAFLVLGFIAWITGRSGAGLVAGIFLLGFAGTFIAEKAGIITIPSLVQTIVSLAALICLAVIIWAAGANWWKTSKAQEKIDAKNMPDATLCKNEDSDWVKIPTGHYKDSDGGCIEGTPPSPPNTGSRIMTQATILRFDGFTPCEPSIDYKFELDTQGDPISLKFPGIEKPLEYSGKGVLQAPEHRDFGEVHITSKDSRKQVRVRIWEVVNIPQ